MIFGGSGASGAAVQCALDGESSLLRPRAMPGQAQARRRASEARRCRDQSRRDGRAPGPGVPGARRPAIGSSSSSSAPCSLSLFLCVLVFCGFRLRDVRQGGGEGARREGRGRGEAGRGREGYAVRDLTACTEERRGAEQMSTKPRARVKSMTKKRRPSLDSGRRGQTGAVEQGWQERMSAKAWGRAGRHAAAAAAAARSGEGRRRQRTGKRRGGRPPPPPPSLTGSGRWRAASRCTARFGRPGHACALHRHDGDINVHAGQTQPGGAVRCGEEGQGQGRRRGPAAE